jgi:lipopolysaccharide/colanic/teichoic acid biosynthesis glycosyltransferase
MYTKFFKRFLDVLISALLLLFFPFILLFVGILIKLDDNGPVFYKGRRLGKDFKEFPMFKFRTMKVNSPDIRNEDGTTFNAEYDPRQTKIGKFLRKTSIDEIPQIINVFIGDMSLVGPRPSPLGNIALYSENYKRKFKLRPGITGYTQATLRNNSTFDDKVINDLFYVDNISFKLDVQILIKTVAMVLKKDGLFTNSNSNHKEI